MSRSRLLLAAGFLVLIVAAPARARAQVCTTDADCLQGTACRPVANPPPKPTPAPEPACPADAGCAKPASTDVAPDIAPILVVMSTCQPIACQVDAECGAGMVCHSETVSVCSGGTAVRGGSCPANIICDAVAPSPPTTQTCTQTTTSSCMFRWQLPCNTDADCGADFVCNPSTTFTCSGSGGSGVAPPAASSGGGTSSSGSGTATPGGTPTAVDAGTVGTVVSVDAAESCTATSSFPGFCRPAATTCATDGDCPAPWTCGTVSTAVGGATTTVGTVSPTTSPLPPDAIAVDAAPPIDAQRVCQAPFSFPVKGGGTVTTAGDGSSAPDGGVGATGGPAPTPPTGGAPSDERASAGGGGCAMGAGQPVGGSVLGLGALAALALWFARRPRRR